MVRELFVKSSKQWEWIGRLSGLEEDFKKRAPIIDEQGRFPSENINALREIGYTKVTLPEEFGGYGFSLYDAILTQETLGSYDASTALSIGWTLMTVGELFENRYWEPNKLAYFAEEVNKGAIINRAVSELATGSPVRGGRPKTKATWVDGKWIINGRKSYTTCSPELDYFLTSSWIEAKETVGFFLIPKEAEGLSIEENWDVISMRGTGSHDLVLKNVAVDESDLVEIPSYHTGFKLNGWALIIPATYLGIAQAARDYAVQFASAHSPNSIKGPISQLPNVQALLGEIELELAKARFTLYGTAEAFISVERRKSLTNEPLIAKHVVTNSALKVVDKAMRVVGAKSLNLSNPLQRYYRDVRAGLHNPPMDDLTISKLAETAFQQYESAVEKNNKGDI